MSSPMDLKRPLEEEVAGSSVVGLSSTDDQPEQKKAKIATTEDSDINKGQETVLSADITSLHKPGVATNGSKKVETNNINNSSSIAANTEASVKDTSDNNIKMTDKDSMKVTEGTDTNNSNIEKSVAKHSATETVTTASDNKVSSTTTNPVASTISKPAKSGSKKYIPVKKEPKKLDPQQIKQLEKDEIIKRQGEISLAPLINKTQVIAYLKSKLPNYDNLKVKVTDEKNFAEFLSVACEEWMAPVLKDMVVYSRHRRRAIRAPSASSSTGTLRSEVAKSLRDIAIKQKELEEKREARKKEWGIGADASDNYSNDAGTNGSTSAAGTPSFSGSHMSIVRLDELNRRQANATASLMTSGRSKTYSWMTGGSSLGSKNTGALGSGTGADGKVRFREARQEEIFAVRDLVKALEKKRKGVDKTLSKGYGKLKDVYR